MEGRFYTPKTLYETKEHAVSYLGVLNFDVRRQNLMEKWINNEFED